MNDLEERATELAEEIRRLRSAGLGNNELSGFVEEDKRYLVALSNLDHKNPEEFVNLYLSNIGGEI